MLNRFTMADCHTAGLPHVRPRCGVKLIVAIAVAVMLAGCAGTPKTVACGETDWFTLGREDALAGEKDGRFKSVADACEDRLAPVFPDAYRRGFAEGLADYCTPEGGFRAGHAGRSYKDLCPTETEVAFLASFEMGERLRRMEAKMTDADRAVAQARKDRDRNAFNLDRAFARLRDNNAAGPEVAAAHRDMEFYSGEVASLDAAIPQLEADARTQAARLAAFRRKLTDAGITAHMDEAPAGGAPAGKEGPRTD